MEDYVEQNGRHYENEAICFKLKKGFAERADCFVVPPANDGYKW